MSEQFFDDLVLEQFSNTFYGYGNYISDYWFIGLEQGGGVSFEEIQQRLQVWVANGKHELEDAAHYHQSIGYGYLFDHEKPKLQATWAKLIRTIYGTQGKMDKDVTAKEIAAYQAKSFLRVNSNSCSIELLPLPSPSMNEWLYAQYSGLDYLQSRAAYREQFAEQRAKAIRQKIAIYRPKLVLFYGVQPEYLTWWKEIAASEFTTKTITGKFTADFALKGRTVFVISRHPVATGLTSEYWHQLGQAIAEYWKP